MQLTLFLDLMHKPKASASDEEHIHTSQNSLEFIIEIGKKNVIDSLTFIKKYSVKIGVQNRTKTRKVENSVRK